MDRKIQLFVLKTAIFGTKIIQLCKGLILENPMKTLLKA